MDYWSLLSIFLIIALTFQHTTTPSRLIVNRQFQQSDKLAPVAFDLNHNIIKIIKKFNDLILN